MRCTVYTHTLSVCPSLRCSQTISTGPTQPLLITPSSSLNRTIGPLCTICVKTETLYTHAYSIHRINIIIISISSIESPRGASLALAKSNGSCIVSIECAETRKKENKTLAGRSQGRRKRYWRGTGGYTCTLGFLYAQYQYLLNVLRLVRKRTRP